ncbi:MAG TPA: hypothetical protein VNP98_13135 [Chthoniobacterales bacterium]|nr:hypothetical protein [Chthoniobacterales bacterium]
MKHSVILIAILLMIVWIIAKITIAVTSLALHLLWIVAIILMVVWLIGRLKAN